MRSALFIDTWGWIAYGYRRDAAHSRVKQFLDDEFSAGTPIYTTDYVLDELLTFIFLRASFTEAANFVRALFDAAQHGFISIERIDVPRFDAAWTLRQRFHDKPQISFTDLTSMVVMQDLGIVDVLTEDQHFLHVGLGFQKVVP
ncbi:MAG: type II toxin-antitoxin system VapC family toxin [Planctomycetaceae bacterium]